MEENGARNTHGYSLSITVAEYHNICFPQILIVQFI